MFVRLLNVVPSLRGGVCGNFVIFELIYEEEVNLM